MNQIIEDLQNLKSWKELMRNSCKLNQLKTINANELTLLKLKSLHLRLSKSYQNLGDKVANIWIENELKTFNWLLIAISGLQNIPIVNFRDEQWQLLEAIFLYKKRSFLKFQAQKLISTKLKNKHWTKQQNDLLLKIVKQSQDDNHQWNDIARKMFQESQEQIFRTGKHCRERWLNYLDPSKQRGEWTYQDDYYLLTRVLESGKKWSEYAAYLNRTEHTVKNRFNSLFIKQKRLTPQIKKQQRLIEQLRKRAQNNHLYSEIGHSQNLEGEAVSVKAQVEEDSPQLYQQIEKVQKIEFEIEKPQLKESIEQKKIKQTVPQQDFNQDFELLRYTKDQEEFKSIGGGGIYSPFWNFSQGSNTPNNFMGSPSPVSFFINTNYTSNYTSNFNIYYHNFITNLSNPVKPTNSDEGNP